MTSPVAARGASTGSLRTRKGGADTILTVPTPVGWRSTGRDGVRVSFRKAVLLYGSGGNGKTTLLNMLSGHIPHDERVVTIEDAAELRLQQPHVARMETRPANVEGKGEITARELVRNALRMRPDRVIVGECRAGEAFERAAPDALSDVAAASALTAAGRAYTAAGDTTNALVAFQRVVDEYEETATVYEAQLRIAELTVGADAFKKP